MSKPLSFLYMDWFCCQGHEISLYNESRVFVAEEVWRSDGRLGLNAHAVLW